MLTFKNLIVDINTCGAKSKFLFAALVLLFFALPCAYAQPVEQVTYPVVQLAEKKQYNLTASQHSSGYFIPPTDADEQLIYRFRETHIAPKGSFDVDFSQTRHYWLLANVLNQSEETLWHLHVSRFFLEEVKVTIIDENGLQQQLSNFNKSVEGVDLTPLGRSFLLQFEQGKKYTLAVEISSNALVITPPIALMPQSTYRTWKSKLTYIYIFPIGMLVAFFLVCVVCFLILRDKTFLWLGISTFLLLFFNLKVSVFRIEFLPIENVRTNSTFLLGAFAMLSAALFSFDFLGVTKRNRTLFPLHLFIISSTTSLIFLSFVLPYKLKAIVFSLNAIVLIFSILYSGIAKIARDGRYYYIYFIGWLPLLTSFLILPLQVITRQEFNEEVTDSYRNIIELYTHCFHVMIHLIALYYRIRHLKTQKLQAEQESRAKSWFIAANSHDLKQPLNSISIHLSLLKKQSLNQQSQELLQNLESACNTMSDTFYSIMTLSRLEAGKQQAKLTVFPLAAVLEKVSSQNRLLAEKKGLKFKLVSSRLFLMSDPTMLERILNNLVSNAIRYTDKGTILIGCRRRKQGIVIQVFDTGRGISEKYLPVIFDTYKRSELEPENNVNMGLGLSIVRHLSELLGFPLKVNSEPGKGSVFELFIPQSALREAENPTHHPLNSEQKLRITLVTPNTSTAMQKFAEKLEQWNYHFQSMHTINMLSKLVSGTGALKLFIVDYELYRHNKEEMAKVGELSRKNGHLVAVTVPEKAETSLLNKLKQCQLQYLFSPPQASQLRAALNYLERKSKN